MQLAVRFLILTDSTSIRVLPLTVVDKQTNTLVWFNDCLPVTLNEKV